ncbi:MAG: CbiX/SirB N-terminal domain-containing protein [Candidatus Methanomethylophilus sp.]|nr:CbiX/SirB N-terminal domain-containing protein [Methanomethylophilus sp.]MDD4221602.1 CbiX/SirB N-terminal domain-containing protein [Methanomethylophilus sp.]MDD4668832.1 CbiX/SirB N-terminal domain-containing protein [Methanomethylophilus sp.]
MNKNGILILGYGSRKPELENIVSTQAARLRARGWDNVYEGYFRVNSPTQAEVLRQVAADGVEDLLVLPYLIAEGRLTYELMPAQWGLNGQYDNEAKVGDRTVRVHWGRAFGGSPALTDIVCDRIAAVGGDRKCTGILLLGHGSKVADNREVIMLNAARLVRRGYQHVAYAFNEFCQPGIPVAVDRLMAEGVDRIIAVPIFIAVGIHLGEEIPEQLGISHYTAEGSVTRNGRTVPLSYVKPLGDDPRLTELLNAQIVGYYGA